jgi:excisionase family DNA binding protein
VQPRIPNMSRQFSEFDQAKKMNAELTTELAAEFLNVSHSFLLGLLGSERLPFLVTGVERRILFDDLVSYKEYIDAERRRALDELASQAQDLKLGY